jgi:hypothetical protein
MLMSWQVTLKGLLLSSNKALIEHLLLSLELADVLGLVCSEQVLLTSEGGTQVLRGDDRSRFFVAMNNGCCSLLSDHCFPSLLMDKALLLLML